MRERREAFRDARLIVIASEGIERARALDKNPADPRLLVCEYINWLRV